MKPAMRALWSPFFSLNWKFGLLLLLVICIPRFFLVLEANETNNYSVIGVVMFVSALLPFIFLNKQGLSNIGIKKTSHFKALLHAFMLGLGLSFLLYIIGIGLYEHSFQNWYVYIAKSYNISTGISPDDRIILFSIMAITGMTFSPIGEEFFFRGIVHTSFAESIGQKKASLVDSLAFAVTHISHFGYVFINGEWDVYPVPAMIWASAMFCVSLLFFQMKKRSDSIWGAVLCHSGFNLGMIYIIFYLL